jgi:hypothetical protein
MGAEQINAQRVEETSDEESDDWIHQSLLASDIWRCRAVSLPTGNRITKERNARKGVLWDQ